MSDPDENGTIVSGMFKYIFHVNFKFLPITTVELWTYLRFSIFVLADLWFSHTHIGKG